MTTVETDRPRKRGRVARRLWSSRHILGAVLATPVLLGGLLIITDASAARSVGASPAPGADPRAAGPIVRNTESAAAGAAFWTAERMAAATPADAALSRKPQPTVAGDSATGKAGTAGGFAPADLIEDAGAPVVAPNLPSSSTGITPADGGFPGPNSTWNYFGKYRKYPVSTVGKLFFTKPGIGNFVCSAAATYGGGNLNTVWTAGHCVSGQGSFWTNFSFCPSYDSSQGGVNPAVGCWGWSSAQVTSAWFNSGWWSGDYARITTVSNGGVCGCSVVSAVGGLGFSWNFGRDQHWMDFGYPSGSPYTGGKLVVTAAEHRYDDNPDPGPDTNSIGSAQTPGFSGGPWILSFANGNWINSVNSYYYTGGPNGNEYGRQIQGPYHDTAVCNFWKGATGWTGTC